MKTFSLELYRVILPMWASAKTWFKRSGLKL